MAYESEWQTAKELLTDFGGPITLRKLVSDEYNEDVMKVEKVYESFQGIGVKLNYTEEVIGESDNIIKAGDVKFICQLPVEPVEDSDQIVFGGRTYSIISFEDLSPDGTTVILYKLQCRKVE